MLLFGKYCNAVVSDLHRYATNLEMHGCAFQGNET
mgnify:CR=1 FL=1|jgi:hypothetical protein